MGDVLSADICLLETDCQAKFSAGMRKADESLKGLLCMCCECCVICKKHFANNNCCYFCLSEQSCHVVLLAVTSGVQIHAFCSRVEGV